MQDAAFHGAEDEGGQRVEIGAAAKAGTGGFQTAANGGGPCGEVAGDELVGRKILGLDFQRKAAQRAAVAALGGKQAFAVAFEDGEDALDGIAMAQESGLDDGGIEALQISFEHGKQEGFLGREEVVETAAVGLSAFEDFGHAGSGVAFFPEEITGCLEQTGAGIIDELVVERSFKLLERSFKFSIFRWGVRSRMPGDASKDDRFAAQQLQWKIAPPMPLASKLAFQFERRLQFKGLNLFHARAVRITDANQSHLYGDVQGGSRYNIRLTYETGRLLVYCSCSYFADFGRCKHLWAAVLEADRRGVLGEAVNGGALRLSRDADPDDERELDQWQFRPPEPPPPPQAPPWQEYLTDIRNSLETRKQKSPAWPRDFEIIYVVDPSASKVAGAIVLELFSRSRKKNGDWTVNKEFRIAPSQVGSLPDPVDVEAIASILGGQEYYVYTYAAASGVAARKAVPHTLALRLIPLIAATGRLFTRRPPSQDLHPLAWDDGEPWKLWLDVRQDDRDQWKITGSLRRGEERMELNEPSLHRWRAAFWWRATKSHAWMTEAPFPGSRASVP